MGWGLASHNLPGTTEIDKASQNHGVATQPSRSRLVCVFRRRHSDGVGPLCCHYLTSVAWTQLDIGLILTIGTITGLALQIPAGALVDHTPAKRLLAALVVALISASALLLALWPIFSVVVAAKVLHAVASSLLGPTLVAISLGLVGYASFGLRLG